MSNVAKTKSRDKKVVVVNDSHKTTPTKASSIGGAYNPLLVESSSSSSLHTTGRFRSIDESDDCDSVSNNGSWSGDSEDHKEKTTAAPPSAKQEATIDNEKREKMRLKNERKHQRQKEKRAQELHERCCQFLMSRKLEVLTQKIIAMEIPHHEKATYALMLNEGKLEESVNWLLDVGGASVEDKKLDPSFGSLKIDISEELGRILELEAKYKWSKQDVERAVVTAEGDVERAEESLRRQKQDHSVKVEDVSSNNSKVPEEELRNLSKVWIFALISISYCYIISSRISKGVLRLLSIIPVCILFLALPLFISSLHFSGSSTLFLSWLANFNLLLFAFDQGPLCPLPSNLCRFFCFACFPIKVRQKASPNAITNRKNEPMPKWVLAVKVLVFGVLLHVYGYKDVLPRFVVLALYCLHIYLEAELVLVFVGAVVSTLLGCDIEPVFNEPYLATSLQDFWSRRWNLMVSAVLRSAVHIPVQRFFTRFFRANIAVLVGVMASFLVSGLMHELIYFYAIRLPPTWEVTCFFVLQGVATTSEIVVKRTLRWTPPHRAVSGLAVMAFVSVTGVWLFLPQLLRNNVHERATGECLLVIDFAKRKLFISSS